MRLNINKGSMVLRAVGFVGAAVWVGSIIVRHCVNSVAEKASATVTEEAQHTCSALRGALDRLRGDL